MRRRVLSQRCQRRIFNSLLGAVVGWLLVGLPIATFVDDRMANNFLLMVPLHIAVIAALSMLTTQTILWRNIYSGEILLYIWGLAVVVIGSAAFCVLNRKVE